MLNPSVNAYYAATLKGKYIPTNHLVFGNIALDTGLKIKKTSLLLRGSAGGAFNSLTSINVNLGDNVSWTNKTFFNNQMYSASFVFKQGIGSKFYINADIGAVFVDKILLDKSYLIKAGVLLGYELGKGFDNQNIATSTRQSSRYQKLKGKNERKTLQSNTASANTTASRARNANITPANSTNNATKTKSSPTIKTDAKAKGADKASKTPKDAKSKEPPKPAKINAKSPKVNLPKVKQTNPKSSSQSKSTQKQPTKKPTTKSATKPNAKPTPKSTKK